MEDRILRDILNEISALRTAIEELTSSVERLRGVGSFKADWPAPRKLRQIEVESVA